MFAASDSPWHRPVPPPKSGASPPFGSRSLCSCARLSSLTRLAARAIAAAPPLTNRDHSPLPLQLRNHPRSTAVIPASKVQGRLLQYYAEARDSADAVVASNGKASSPNVLTLVQPGHAVGMTPSRRSR